MAALTVKTSGLGPRFLTKVDQTEVQEELSNTYIFLLYAAIMFVMYYHANWIWFWIMLIENCRTKPSLPCEKRITKTAELWTNQWCLNALCYEIVMIYGITNLHSHIHFFKKLRCVYHPQWCFISINSVDTRYLNSLQNPFSNQWLYFLVTLYRLC